MNLTVLFVIFVILALLIICAFPPAVVLLVPVGIIFFLIIMISNGKKKKKKHTQQAAPDYADDERTVMLDHPAGADDEKTVFMWEQEGIRGIVALMDMNGGGTIFQKAIDSEIILGKDESCCDVCIRYDKTISRKHCKIRRWGNEFFLSDEGSSNGTSVNGKNVTGEPVSLASDDVITLGRTQLKFQILG